MRSYQTSHADGRRKPQHRTITSPVAPYILKNSPKIQTGKNFPGLVLFTETDLIGTYHLLQESRWHCRDRRPGFRFLQASFSMCQRTRFSTGSGLRIRLSPSVCLTDPIPPVRPARPVRTISCAAAARPVTCPPSYRTPPTPTGVGSIRAIAAAILACPASVDDRGCSIDREMAADDPCCRSRSVYRSVPL